MAGTVAGIAAGHTTETVAGIRDVARAFEDIVCARMLTNIHMCLLDFLTWDRARTLTCGREDKQEAYWNSLLPSLDGGGDGWGNGDAGAGQGASGDDDGFGGAPETTLAGAYPGESAWIFRVAETRGDSSSGGFPSRGATTHRCSSRFCGSGDSGKEDEQGSIPLQAIAFDSLGEVIRILRYVMQSEESRPFSGTPTNADVNPEGVVTGHQPRRPLELGTILKRAENGWYDMDPGSQVR